MGAAGKKGFGLDLHVSLSKKYITIFSATHALNEATTNLYVLLMILFILLLTRLWM